MSAHNVMGSQRAQDVLTCRLCSQYLHEPRQLPCGHSFCLPCLERYYLAECQRLENARRRSPSVERRRRGLLPCPAAPICLHVSVVPDEGVAGFPINQKIANIKEHVVNEMAYNISRRLGRPHSGFGEQDATSVRSDETDFSDVSCETTCSAPAAGASDGTSPYPNLAKYAKYFDAEKDGADSTRYTPSLRSERRRTAISSSFQHRRRRVHTPSPAAFDDSSMSRPSRAGSAPHLDTEGASYRPTVKPRQGSSIASPLLRRARPTSCIIEELNDDDDEFMNLFGDATSPDETPRKATSTEKTRRPLFHEHVVLPTHLENISMDGNGRSVASKHESVTRDKPSEKLSSSEDRRSMPAKDEPTRHDQPQTDDVKTGNVSGKTDDSLRHRQQQVSENVDNTKISGSTTTVQDETHEKRRFEQLETGNKASNTKSTLRQDGPTIEQNKEHSDLSETSSKVPDGEAHSQEKHHSHSTAPSHSEQSKNSKSHGDQLKTEKTSKPVSSRTGRRVLPDIPTHGTGSSVSRANTDGVRQDVGTSTSSRHHARQLPRTDHYSVLQHHSNSSEDPDISKSKRENISDPSKPKSSAACQSDANKSLRLSVRTSADPKLQKTADTGFIGSNARCSRPAKSNSVEAVHAKPSASTKSRDAISSFINRSKSYTSSLKTATSDAASSQKTQPDSKKFSSSPNVGRSTATVGKVDGTERAKTSHVSESADKDETVCPGSEHKEKGSGSSASTDKSRASKSTPGSGSRLTYKVNASTIHPVLMNGRKSKRGSRDTERRLSIEMSTENDAVKETMATSDNKTQEEYRDASEFSQNDSNVSPLNVSNENQYCNVEDADSSSKCDSGIGTSPTSQAGVGSETHDEPAGQAGDHLAQHPHGHSTSHAVDYKLQHPHELSDRNTSERTSQQRHAAADVESPVSDAQAVTKNTEEADKKKQQQWKDFMATLHAARSKYSSTDNQIPTSESSHQSPVYSDVITLRWRIQRDDFAIPTSIAIAADGSAVIADVANCLLDFADVEGNILHSVTGTKPFSVAVGSDNLIYVGDRRSRTVRVFDIYGSDVAQWDAESTSFGWIGGIATLRNGQLAIVDRERCKVGIYTSGGERVTEFGSYGTKDAQLCMSDFVAVDSHDRVIVSDSGNHQVKMFDPSSGKLAGHFASRGEADGCLLWPKGVTVDDADRIIVADSGNDRICQFSQEGRFILNVVSAAVRPYHVNCGGDRLLGVTHFALSGASQVDVFDCVTPV